ncbi:MAG: CesT family type III secretion system chaperone [Oxalobacteraceae bacterium]|jgi:hypothetical protein|nr:CesT family type III secretion system chaperone [Oxalobacteraceae bacterium]
MITDAFQSRLKFLKIINEIRELLGYTLNNQEDDHGDDLVMEMMYGGFDFSLVHSNINATHKLLLESDFGSIPETNEQLILLRLLAMNSALAELDSSVFCINADTNRLTYALSLDISDLDGQQLLSKMTEVVWHGKRWCDSNFLSKAENSESNSVNLSVLA